MIRRRGGHHLDVIKARRHWAGSARRLRPPSLARRSPNCQRPGPAALDCSPDGFCRPNITRSEWDCTCPQDDSVLLAPSSLLVPYLEVLSETWTEASEPKREHLACADLAFESEGKILKPAGRAWS
jgi:hypothetical protein